MDEIILWGGVIAAGSALLAGLITFFVIKMRSISLESRFDEEYGKREHK